jgi:hypothetical protein
LARRSDQQSPDKRWNGFGSSWTPIASGDETDDSKASNDEEVSLALQSANSILPLKQRWIFLAMPLQLDFDLRETTILQTWIRVIASIHSKQIPSTVLHIHGLRNHFKFTFSTTQFSHYPHRPEAALLDRPSRPDRRSFLSSSPRHPSLSHRRLSIPVQPKRKPCFRNPASSSPPWPGLE